MKFVLYITLCFAAACGLAAMPAAGSETAAGAAATSQPTKAWAADLPAFLSDRPGHWIVARSEKPALSAQEAEVLARGEAARAVLPIVAGRLRGPATADRNALTSRVEASLFRDDWIVDRQIQSAERPYGTLWSAALLIDASPPKVDALVRQIEHQTRQRHARTVGGLLALFVVTAMVGSGYVLLNWLTRGFFRGRLAVGSLLVVASAVIGVVHLLR